MGGSYPLVIVLVNGLFLKGNHVLGVDSSP